MGTTVHMTVTTRRQEWTFWEGHGFVLDEVRRHATTLPEPHPDDIVTLECEDASVGELVVSNMPTNLTYFGYHDGDGNNYPAEVFACDGATLIKLEGDISELMFRVDNDGNPEPESILAAQSFFELRNTIKQRFGLDVDKSHARWSCGKCKQNFTSTDDGYPHSDGCGLAHCFKCMGPLHICPTCLEPTELASEEVVRAYECGVTAHKNGAPRSGLTSEAARVLLGEGGQQAFWMGWDFADREVRESVREGLGLLRYEVPPVDEAIAEVIAEANEWEKKATETAHVINQLRPHWTSSVADTGGNILCIEVCPQDFTFLFGNAGETVQGVFNHREDEGPADSHPSLDTRVMVDSFEPSLLAKRIVECIDAFYEAQNAKYRVTLEFDSIAGRKKVERRIHWLVNDYILKDVRGQEYQMPIGEVKVAIQSTASFDS